MKKRTAKTRKAVKVKTAKRTVKAKTVKRTVKAKGMTFYKAPLNYVSSGFNSFVSYFK